MIQAARFQTIVVPTDFSPISERALTFARELASAAGPSHLIVVNAYALPLEIEALAVQGVEKVYEDLAAEADRKLEEIVRGLRGEGVSAEFSGKHGRPENVISELARKANADLIVMGTHGRTGLAHLMLGSVAERVLRTATCPVISVR